MTAKVNLNNLKAHKTKNDKSEFNKLLSEFLPELKKLVSHKIRQWEIKGIIPKGTYSADEITDEVYLRIFEEFHDKLTDDKELKIKMLAISRELLDNIREKHSGKRISVENLLKEELKDLEEDYTINADGEPILMEELDDISYQPKEKEEIILLQEEHFIDISESFELPDKNKLSREDKMLIGKVYSDLPELTRSVIDHYVFVKLTTVEIADIHNIPVKDVEKIIDRVKQRLKKLSR
ncbi:MAG: sigma-70 family RNA polymerase sigma factor [Chlorobi bacterium]|nr:sigma-70 family RNA polymerase sigma factor [Chlorobiota bacterium]